MNNYHCPICESKEYTPIITTYVQMQEDPRRYTFCKCQNCQTIFLSHPPNKSELDEFYGKDYLPYLGPASWGKFQKFVALGQKQIDRKRTARVLKAYPNITNSTRVLDFGCGNPSFLNNLQKQTHAQCVGYDIYSFGWKNMMREFSSLEFIEGEVEKLKLSNKFQIITMWHTLEHEFYPNKILNILHDISSKDAILIIEVPNYNSLTRKIQKEYWAGYHTPRHSVIYTPKTLEYILKNNGWKITNSKSFGTIDSFTIWWLGYFEKRRKTQSLNNIFLQDFFWNFVILKLLLLFIFIWEKFFSFGVMTVVCEKDS